MSTTNLEPSQEDPTLSEAPAASRDLLLACLLKITQLKQAPCSETSLLAGLPLVDQCLSPELFVRAASRAGLDAKVVERELSEIPSLVLPVVLLFENNQAKVLLAVEEGSDQYTVYCPEADEELILSEDALKAEYTGHAIYTKVVQEEYQTAKHDARSKREWFWSVLKSSWKIYRDVLIASFFINLFAIATPLFVMNVYDRVVPNEALETLWVLAIGVLLVFVFDVVLKGLRGYFIEVAGKKADILLSSFLFERVLGSRYSEKPPSVGAFVSQFREFDTVRNFYTSSTIVALVDLPFVLLFLLIILYVGGVLVWVPIIAIPIIVGYSLLLQKPINDAVEQTFTASSYKNSTLVESLVALETVKVLGAEGQLQRLWEKSVGHLAQWGQRMRMLSLSVNLFAGLTQQFASVIMIIVGVYLIVERELTMGALVASFMLASRAMAPISQVASLLVSYDQTKTALSALDDIVAKKQERTPEKPFVKRPSFSGAVQFDQVSFAYPNEKQAALEKISFKINPGDRVAIIGRIGSGKSTIQKLLLNLYQPNDGSVLFDGIDSLQIDPADLRGHIGYVPQDVVLFAGSIKDNILFGTHGVTDEEMIKAAELSGVREFVDRHPLGFDRQVGERGQGLSGGQRQSIGIARAMLQNPSIYLMDEPTSGMDNATETSVRNHLQEVLEDKTLVLVTHKTSLLSLVNRVIVLENGRLLADGPKDAVLDALKKGQLRVPQN